MSSTLENKVKSLKEGREQLQNEVDILGDYSRRLGDAVVEMKSDLRWLKILMVCNVVGLVVVIIRFYL